MKKTKRRIKGIEMIARGIRRKKNPTKGNSKKR